MIIDGLEIAAGSEIANVHIESGSSFPANPNQGRAFYLDSNDSNEGLYIFNGTEWTTGDVKSVIAGPGLSGGGLSGDITLSVDTAAIAPLNNAHFTGETSFEDNVIIVNDGEQGAGVTGGLAGFEVNRGTAPEGSFRFVFDESDDYFKFGFVGNLEIAADRTWVGSNYTPLAHSTDMGMHLTLEQNNLLDGLSISLSAAELNYVEGVTSGIQSQIDSKLSLAGGVLTGNLTLAGAPTSDLHAASKAYVDAATTGLDLKASVVAATTGNITLSGEQTIDGVAIVAGDRVLVKAQTTPEENGIYDAAVGAWVRSSDADNMPGSEVTSGMFVFIEEGSINANSGWVLTTSTEIILDTTPLSFSQFSSTGQVTAGAGMTKTGNVLDVVGSSNIDVAVDSIDLSDTGVGAGTYTSVTVDTKGRVIGATNPTTLSGYGITDAAPLVVQHEEFTATAGQTVFTFGSIVNVVGLHRLEVYVSGIKQAESSYIETANDITLPTGLTAGTIVEVYFR